MMILRNIISCRLLTVAFILFFSGWLQQQQNNGVFAEEEDEEEVHLALNDEDDDFYAEIKPDPIITKERDLKLFNVLKKQKAQTTSSSNVAFQAMLQANIDAAVLAAGYILDGIDPAIISAETQTMIEDCKEYLVGAKGSSQNPHDSVGPLQLALKRLKRLLKKLDDTLAYSILETISVVIVLLDALGGPGGPVTIPLGPIPSLPRLPIPPFPRIPRMPAIASTEVKAPTSAPIEPGSVQVASSRASEGNTASSTKQKCFVDGLELRTAVHAAYKLNDTSVFVKYGAPINDWCVDAVADFSEVFYNMSQFNEDISGWNTSSATHMPGMFLSARSFNQDISTWDTSKVVSMGSMFSNARAFNQPIGTWDTSSVTTMSYMFFAASAFDQDIGNWNVGKLVSARDMFYDASAFNQNLCPWGNKINASTADVGGMMTGTSCPNQTHPQLNTTPLGPFCYVC